MESKNDGYLVYFKCSSYNAGLSRIALVDDISSILIHSNIQLLRVGTNFHRSGVL